MRASCVAQWNRSGCQACGHIPRLMARGDCDEPRPLCSAAPMQSADLKLLRAMRTRWHTPGREAAAVALGKAGNNALIWLLLGVALALIDPARREQWLICAALGPIA